MQRLRSAGFLFRLLLVVMFGFVSLIHGPVMAFAKETASASHNHVVAADAAHGEHQLPAVTDKPALCFSLACCVAIEATAITAAAVDFLPLNKLFPARAHILVDAMLNPVDPPPRLQV